MSVAGSARHRRPDSIRVGMSVAGSARHIRAEARSSTTIVTLGVGVCSRWVLPLPNRKHTAPSWTCILRQPSSKLYQHTRGGVRQRSACNATFECCTRRLLARTGAVRFQIVLHRRQGAAAAAATAAAAGACLSMGAAACVEVFFAKRAAHSGPRRVKRFERGAAGLVWQVLRGQLGKKSRGLGSRHAMQHLQGRA
eukprot:364594-Chlamydomonas_euryale.AAC.13